MKRLFLALSLSILFIPFGLSQDLPSYVPTDGLVAYYPFNGNANDQSGNGHHGTVNGATLSSDLSGVNSGYSFSSSQANISVSNYNILNLSDTDFTISVWAKLDATPLSESNEDFNQYYTILGKRQYARRRSNYSVGISTPNSNIGGLRFTFAQGPRGVGSFIYSDQPIQATENWNNMVLVYTLDDNTIKFFVNGNLLYQEVGVVVNSENVNDADLWFGSDVSGYADDFPGKIDDIGFWNRALTEQEIQNLFTSSNGSTTGDILLNGTVSAENHQIKNVADPTDAQDVITKSYFDSNTPIAPNKNIEQILSYGNDANGKQLKGLADPTEAQDAVTLSLLQSKIDELIQRIENLENDGEEDCGSSYLEDFNSCDLTDYHASGGNISSTTNGYDGCGVYMTHYAGQDPNNFYAIDKKFLYGVYELDAIADNGISDNIVRVLQQEELSGGYTFSFRPTSTDNPGWSVFNDGELVDSANTFPVARGNWYSIKIEVLKSSLKIWINDVILFETDSITPPSDVPGYFKVGVAFSGAFDNLKYTPDSSLCN